MQFVDTNVLLYAVSRDPEEQDKAQRANDILGARDVALSVQVLQEFYVQATRESRPDPLAHEQAAKLVESFLRFPVQPITTEVMLAATAPRQRFVISYWSAATLDAGRSLGYIASNAAKMFDAGLRANATAVEVLGRREGLWRDSLDSAQTRHTLRLMP